MVQSERFAFSADVSARFSGSKMVHAHWSADNLSIFRNFNPF